MKKIIVFYGTYGGGHIAAAKSIANHIFDNNPEIDVEAIDCIEYINKYLNRITTDAYKGATKKTPSVWKYVYKKSNQGALAKITTASNKLMASKLKKLILNKKPDLIISTHPFSSQMCAYLKKKEIINCELATVMTDFHVHNQWLYLPEYVNYFFVANNLMKDQMINNDNIPEEKIYVTGIPISDKFKKDYSGMSGITRMAQEGRRAYDSLRSLMQDMAKDSISENEKRISIASDLKSVYYDARSAKDSNVQSKAKSWDSRLNSAQAKARGIRDFEQAFRKESSRLGKVDDFQNSSYLRGKTEQQIEADIKNFYLAVFSLQQFFDFYKVSAPNELRNALVQEASKYGLRYYR